MKIPEGQRNQGKLLRACQDFTESLWQSTPLRSTPKCGMLSQASLCSQAILYTQGVHQCVSPTFLWIYRINMRHSERGEPRGEAILISAAYIWSKTHILQAMIEGCNFWERKKKGNWNSRKEKVFGSQASLMFHCSGNRTYRVVF